MRREHLEHVVAAAANIAGEDDFVVIGSQAILGSHPNAPGALLRSLEIDFYPAMEPGKADLIDGALGDGSPFHRSFGYYGHGVGPETAKAPGGWRERLVRVDVPPRLNSPRRPVAWCLEPHDLVLAKCVAGRDRDWQFARDALGAGLVDVRVLLEACRSAALISSKCSGYSVRSKFPNSGSGVRGFGGNGTSQG